MDLSDSFDIPAPRDLVWSLLMDPDVLRRCIPGCQSLEGNIADGLAASVKIGIGPVKATFSGSVTLTDLVPPQSFRITGSGNGGAAGLASGGATVTLEGTDTGTRLTYTADAKISGKLAQLGSRLITASVAKLSGQFFASFAEIATAAGQSPE